MEGLSDSDLVEKTFFVTFFCSRSKFFCNKSERDAVPCGSVVLLPGPDDREGKSVSGE